MPSTNEHRLPLRPCTGVVLFNADGLVWVGERIDTPGAWQFPQGGIDAGEPPQTAAFRELEEEIGTRNARLLMEHPEWLDYDLPSELVGVPWGGKFRGQTQKWFALEFLGTDEEIDIRTDHQEFSQWRWVSLEEAVALGVAFKREIYRRLAQDFGHLGQ